MADGSGDHSLGALSQRMGALERTVRGFVEAWAEERRGIFDAIERQGDKFNQAVEVIRQAGSARAEPKYGVWMGAAAIFLTFVGMAGNIIDSNSQARTDTLNVAVGALAAQSAQADRVLMEHQKRVEEKMTVDDLREALDKGTNSAQWRDIRHLQQQIDALNRKTFGMDVSPVQDGH